MWKSVAFVCALALIGCAAPDQGSEGAFDEANPDSDEIHNASSKRPFYFFGVVQVSDFEAFGPYIAQTPQVIRDYGGEFLDVVQAVETLEGTWPAGAVTGVVRFRKRESFEAFYNSPEYAPLKELRQTVATTDAALLQALPLPRDAKSEAGWQQGQGYYFLGIVDLKDPAAFGPYIQQTPAVIRQYGGQLVDAVQAVETLEGSWPVGAVTGVVRFPDRESFDAFYGSPEYAPLKELRQSVATTNAALLQALPLPPSDPN